MLSKAIGVARSAGSAIRRMFVSARLPQLSLASAQAIWERVQRATQPMKPRAFLRLSDAELRTAGDVYPEFVLDAETV